MLFQMNTKVVGYMCTPAFWQLLKAVVSLACFPLRGLLLGIFQLHLPLVDLHAMPGQVLGSNISISYKYIRLERNQAFQLSLSPGYVGALMFIIMSLSNVFKSEIYHLTSISPRQETSQLFGQRSGKTPRFCARKWKAEVGVGDDGYF